MSANALYDLVISPTICGRNVFFGHSQECANVRTMGRIQELATANESGNVGEYAGTHRVALTGDRIGSRAGLPNVAGHQRKIDDRLGGACRLVALVHAHGPPKGNAPTAGNSCGEAVNWFVAKTGLNRDSLRAKVLEEFRECIEANGVGIHEISLHCAECEQPVRHPVEQGQIALRSQRIMLGGGHSRFRLPWVNHDDLRAMRIAHDPLPQNRMSDARIGPYKY